MKVEVVRSSRRVKTVMLRPTPEGVRISIPAGATQAEEQSYVDTLMRRYLERNSRTELDLTGRAFRLADTYGLRRPSSIEWSDRQNSRWGSCTINTGAIRISSPVAKFPDWVLDYVIVHELAHLSEAGHGKAFWNLVERYPKTERARGFLIAKGLGDQDDSVAD